MGVEEETKGSEATEAVRDSTIDHTNNTDRANVHTIWWIVYIYLDQMSLLSYIQNMYN